jgi:chromosome segregation ATPase
MTSIPNLNLPTLTILQHDVQANFGLKRAASNNTNEESSSKRAKTLAAVTLASIESVISTVGNDALQMQNPTETEHLIRSPDHLSQESSTQECPSVESPRKVTKSFRKFTDEELQQTIDACESSKTLAKESKNSILKLNHKLLAYKYKKNIAKNDCLVIKEKFDLFKVESESELNKTKAENRAINESYNKKINSTEAAHKQNLQSLLDHIEKLRDQITTLENGSKIEHEPEIEKLKNDHKSEITHFKSQIKKRDDDIKKLNSKVSAAAKKNKQNIQEKKREIKLLQKNNAAEVKDVEKYKKTIESKEKVIKTFEQGLIKLKEEVKQRRDENKRVEEHGNKLQMQINALSSQKVDLTKKCQSVEEELDSKKKELQKLAEHLKTVEASDAMNKQKLNSIREIVDE